jgi:5-methylcytosine-specific restriction protein A
MYEQRIKANKTLEIEEVHHNLPLSQGASHNRDKLAAPCNNCHARIHAKMAIDGNSLRAFS